MRALLWLALPVGVVAGAYLTRAWFAWRERHRFSGTLPPGVRSRTPLSRAQLRRRRQKQRR